MLIQARGAMRRFVTVKLGRSSVLELFRKGGIAFLLKGCAGGVGFFLTLILARVLGAEESGLYFLALTLVSVAAALPRLGVDQYLTRFVGVYSYKKMWGEINSLYKTSVFGVSVVATFLSVLLFFYAALISEVIFNKPELTSSLRYMSLSVVPLSVCWIHAHCFQGLSNVVYFHFFQNLGVSITFLCFVLFIGDWVEGDAGVYAVLYSVASVVVLGVAVFIWFRTSWFLWGAAKIRLKGLLHGALPLYGAGVLGLVMEWFTLLYLGGTASSSDVALFGAALRTSALISMVLMVVNSVVFPKFATIYSTGNLQELKLVAVWATRLTILMCAPLMLVAISIPDTVMGFFGGEFVRASPSFVILVVGQFFNVVTGSVGGLLNMTGHAKLAFYCTLLSVVVLVLLSLFLVPSYGLVGAALAQSIAVSLQMILFTLVVKRKLGFVPANVFYRI
jgi:O-antigen/teichoic acid export membrane protein